MLYNLLKELLFLERVPVALINLLRSKTPPITIIESLSGHYEDIAESSDDELDADDKSTNSSKQVTIEELNNATCFEPPPQISRMVEAPTSPQPKKATSTYAASTGIS